MTSARSPTARLAAAVFFALVLSVFALSPAFASQEDYYWLSGAGDRQTRNLWFLPVPFASMFYSPGWSLVSIECELEKSGPHCYATHQDSNYVNGNNVFFKYHSAQVYPMQSNVYVNKDDYIIINPHDFPLVYGFEIDNSKFGHNYVFQPASGLSHAQIRGGTDVNYLKPFPAEITIGGSSSANRYTATFINVDLSPLPSSWGCCPWSSPAGPGPIPATHSAQASFSA